MNFLIKFKGGLFTWPNQDDRMNMTEPRQQLTLTIEHDRIFNMCFGHVQRLMFVGVIFRSSSNVKVHWCEFSNWFLVILLRSSKQASLNSDHRRWWKRCLCIIGDHNWKKVHPPGWSLQWQNLKIPYVVFQSFIVF